MNSAGSDNNPKPPQPAPARSTARPPGLLTGLRVLALESRRAAEMAKLISAHGGEATIAPSMQEVPLTSHVEALDFARAVRSGGFDLIIFMTGVGARLLGRIAASLYPQHYFAEAMRRIPIVARSGKAVAALKEFGVYTAVSVPEPNTWKDILAFLDERADSLPIEGRRVAVQEYGESNLEFLAALAERGALVTRVPIYQWALPDDTAPLRAAVESIARGEIDIALFTTSVQIVHLLRIAAEMNMEAAVRRAFTRIVVGSIGPVTSEALCEHGLPVDFEPEHPKMGFLLSEAAQRAPELVQRKRRL